MGHEKVVRALYFVSFGMVKVVLHEQRTAGISNVTFLTVLVLIIIERDNG